jgi:hypothetical protein
VVTPVAVAAKERQELLLMWEEELTRRDEALTTREEKTWVSEKTLTKVSADLDGERVRDEATRQEYLDKMVAHTAHAKRSLGLNMMLDRRERDLALHEAVLVEA